MKYQLHILLLIASTTLVAACSSHRAVYSDEKFADDSPFKKRMQAGVEPACESARRVLLGQGYLIETANSDGVKARKAVKREDKPNTFIEMNIVCLPENAGSTVFATGLLTTYALKKSSSSASVGVSAVGSISLPIGQSADSLVKVSEDTIEDTGFYQRFFGAVSNTLAGLQPALPPAEIAAEPASPEVIADPAEAVLAGEFTAAGAPAQDTAAGIILREGPILPADGPQPAGAALDFQTYTLAPAAPAQDSPAETPPPQAASSEPAAAVSAPPGDPGQAGETASAPVAEPAAAPEPAIPLVAEEPAPTAAAEAEPADEALDVLQEVMADPADTRPAEPAGEQVPASAQYLYSDPADWHYDEE